MPCGVARPLRSRPLFHDPAGRWQASYAGIIVQRGRRVALE